MSTLTPRAKRGGCPVLIRVSTQDLARARGKQLPVIVVHHLLE